MEQVDLPDRNGYYWLCRNGQCELVFVYHQYQLMQKFFSPPEAFPEDGLWYRILSPLEQTLKCVDCKLEQTQCR